MRRSNITLGGWGFQELKIDDRELYEQFIKSTPWPVDLWSSNFPYIWAHSRAPRVKVLWRIIDGLLVTFSLSTTKKLLVFCLPFGFNTKEQLVEVLYQALKFCAKYNGTDNSQAKLRMINSNQLEFLKSIKEFPQLFDVVKISAIERHYSLQQLINLKGKKFKSLRQKLSKYERSYPKVEIRQYQPSDYNKLLSLNDYWQSTAGKNYRLILDKTYFKEIIKHHEALGLTVLVAELDDRIVGMISGGELPTGQSWACLGKADKRIDGLSEVLLLRLVDLLYKSNTTINLLNDGSDLNAEGLSQYKEKFRPVLNLKRYKVFLK